MQVWYSKLNFHAVDYKMLSGKHINLDMQLLLNCTKLKWEKRSFN